MRVIIKALIAVALALLVGCADPNQNLIDAISPGSNPQWSRYGFSPSDAKNISLTGLNPESAEIWVDQGVSRSSIAAWHANGVSVEQALSWQEKGVSDPSEAMRWDNLLKKYPNKISKSDLEKLVSAKNKNLFTIDSLDSSFASSDPNLPRPIYEIKAALISKGVSVEESDRRAKEKFSRYMNQMLLTAYGPALSRDCNGRVEGFPIMSDWSPADPYTIEGKCYEFNRVVSPSSVQWLGEAKALVPGIGWLFVGGKHWSFNNGTLLVKGLHPIPYTSTLGATITPMTFAVLGEVRSDIKPSLQEMIDTP